MKKLIQSQIIKDCVCNYYRIPEENIFIKSRRAEIIEPRQVYHYFMRKYTNKSLSAIGEGWDHASVLHSARQVQNRIDVDYNFQRKIEAIKSLLECSNNVNTGLISSKIKDCVTNLDLIERMEIEILKLEEQEHERAKTLDVVFDIVEVY